MPDLVILQIVFVAMGVGLLLVGMIVGKLIRPSKPSEEKGTVYECGEPAIGSSWIQFDLRFYVVALLFVIFDVEMAFFFPWATVFGGANKLANPDVGLEEKYAIQQSLTGSVATKIPDPADAHALAIVAFCDILIFFAVLIVGFAYLWKRGDLEWVRSVVSQNKETEVIPDRDAIATESKPETPAIAV